MSKDNLAIFNTLWKEQNEIYRKASKRFGMSESVFWILYSLLEAGGTMGQREINAAICMPKQTTNTALKKLEIEGMITMTESSSRRCKDVSLTEKGQNAAELTAGRVITAEHTALGKLSEDEQKQFLETFRRYNKILNKTIGEIK